MTDTSVRRRHTPARRVLGIVAMLALLLGGAGCGLTGDPDGGGDGRDLADIVREALEEAKNRQQQKSGNTSADDPSGTIGTDGRTEFDYDQYQNTLKGTIGLLERYWSETLPTLGAAYRSPQAYTYYRSDEGQGPACGQQPAPPNNAFYCPAGDFIAWDESGLMIPYYVQGGDFAASFVLAHEFGHAMQARLPDQEQLGVLRELQADCFAGAWARWVSRQKLLAAGDLDEATLAVFIARDVPGTPWTDPAAHGSGFERTRAFGDGFKSGAKSCYPAPAEDWIIAQS
jgi:predicted metalloprotease